MTKRHHYRQHTPKLTTLILTILLALTITGISYTYWTDTLNIFGTIRTGNIKITIDNQKLIPDIGYGKTPNNKTVSVSATITQGWEIWVGIIIKNKGTVPVTINYEITTNNPPYETYFGNDTYFYGPYTTTPPNAVWDGFDVLNPPTEETPPIDLPVDNILVVWQKLWLKPPPPEAFTITITSEYKATLGPWHEEVAVMYYLDKG